MPFKKQPLIVQNALTELQLNEHDSLTDEIINRSYKKQALLHHPDHGGKAEKFIAIYKARQTLLQYLNNEIIDTIPLEAFNADLSAHNTFLQEEIDLLKESLELLKRLIEKGGEILAIQSKKIETLTPQIDALTHRLELADQQVAELYQSSITINQTMEANSESLRQLQVGIAELRQQQKENEENNLPVELICRSFLDLLKQHLEGHIHLAASEIQTLLEKIKPAISQSSLSKADLVPYFVQYLLANQTENVTRTVTLESDAKVYFFSLLMTAFNKINKAINISFLELKYPLAILICWAEEVFNNELALPVESIEELSKLIEFVPLPLLINFLTPFLKSAGIKNISLTLENPNKLRLILSIEEQEHSIFLPRSSMLSLIPLFSLHQTNIRSYLAMATPDELIPFLQEYRTHPEHHELVTMLIEESNEDNHLHLKSVITVRENQLYLLNLLTLDSQDFPEIEIPWNQMRWPSFVQHWPHACEEIGNQIFSNPNLWSLLTLEFVEYLLFVPQVFFRLITLNEDNLKLFCELFLPSILSAIRYRSENTFLIKLNWSEVKINLSEISPSNLLSIPFRVQIRDKPEIQSHYIVNSAIQSVPTPLWNLICNGLLVLGPNQEKTKYLSALFLSAAKLNNTWHSLWNHLLPDERQELLKKFPKLALALKDSSDLNFKEWFFSYYAQDWQIASEYWSLSYENQLHWITNSTHTENRTLNILEKLLAKEINNGTNSTKENHPRVRYSLYACRPSIFNISPTAIKITESSPRSKKKVSHAVKII